MYNGWLTSAARRALTTAAVLLLAIAVPASAQYFGQNKVQYEQFDFHVLKTTHFDIYYYPEEAKPVQDIALMAERWYARLSRVLGVELTSRQPIVIYASHPHFAQTNVVEGFIDEGTGGVTEGQMHRVTLPFAGSLGETDHVLGHELVHAFQFDVLGQAGEMLPLWFVEGMAEYLSIGPRDVQTSMWLRDATIEKRLPAIKNLDDPRYFPYRFGHAFWAYIGGKFGDEKIGEILRAISMEGPNGGDAIATIESETGVSAKALSTEWQAAIEAAARPVIERSSLSEDARVVGKDVGSGALNVGPSISPDGSRIAFLSGRDRMSIDLYVADTRTGKVTGKLIDTAADPHFDSLQFLASAGAWSPDGQELAIATIRRSRPVLAIVDVDRKHVEREIEFRQLGEIFQPSWSPDGKYIAFSAQAGGVTDLFVHDLTTGTTRRLTDDEFADLQPDWSPDGKSLVFVTDRFSSNPAELAFRGGYQLATIKIDGGEPEPLDVPLDGNVTNPQWAASGRLLFFLSDHGGRQNAYRMDVATQAVTMLTNVPTGVAGITPLSPALSVSRTGNLAGVSLFRDSGYFIAVLPDIESVSTPPVAVGDAAMLPPIPRPDGTVAELLSRPQSGLPARTPIEPRPYSKGLHLLAIGQQAGLATSSTFGFYASAGISFLFSDTLGNHLLGTGFGINGGVHDIFAEVQYLNRASRWNWGVFAQRVPLLSGTAEQGLATQNGNLVIVDQVDLFRQTITRMGGTVAYPFDRATRIEFGGSTEHISYTHETQSTVYDAVTGINLGDSTVQQPTPSALSLYDASAAIVRDTAVYGATSPLRGMRTRIEVAPTVGDLRFTSLTVDYRRYFMPVRPVTFAARVLHVGRYGPDSEDSHLLPLFLGYPTLVRGYDANSFSALECTPTPTGTCPEFDRLFGSRLLVLNGEVRAPLVGLFKGKLTYGRVPAEIFAFTDSGLAWTSNGIPSLSNNWITSAGAGVRVNVLGFLIAEFNAVRAFDRPLHPWAFVFNIRPGF